VRLQVETNLKRRFAESAAVQSDICSVEIATTTKVLAVIGGEVGKLKREREREIEEGGAGLLGGEGQGI
jgi:hypothetical protein